VCVGGGHKKICVPLTVLQVKVGVADEDTHMSTLPKDIWQRTADSCSSNTVRVAARHMGLLNSASFSSTRADSKGEKISRQLWGQAPTESNSSRALGSSMSFPEFHSGNTFTYRIGCCQETPCVVPTLAPVLFSKHAHPNTTNNLPTADRGRAHTPAINLCSCCCCCC
jgi:hypothetical protein